MTDFNITCLKICFPFVFFFLIVSFFFFVPLHQRVSIFLFLLFFPLTFPSSFFFFFELSIRIIKPKRNHFGINLYLSFCSYFMGLFIFVFGVSIFTRYLCQLYQFSFFLSSFFFFFSPLSFPFLCGYFQTFHSNTNSH